MKTMCRCNGKGFTVEGKENEYYTVKCGCMTDQQRKEAAIRETNILKERIRKIRGGDRIGEMEHAG